MSAISIKDDCLQTADGRRQQIPPEMPHAPRLLQTAVCRLPSPFLLFGCRPVRMEGVFSFNRFAVAMIRTTLLSCLLFGLVCPVFGADDEPWLVESKGAVTPIKRERMLWADRMQYKSIAEICGEPVIEIERWVNTPPKDLTGKFVLVKVWATWCPPCRRSLPLLEYFHEKYKDELVVVSICETDEKALQEMAGPVKLADLKAPLAVDTHRRFANALGVYGIPHAVLIEPTAGIVLWEGMPTQIGAELSDERMAKILANLKNPAVKEKIPPKAPFEFKACPPDPNKKYRSPPENVGNAEW